jgi:hypothetical protein
LDDTDTLESRGTGHLARRIAGELSQVMAVQGITRHQLLVDPRVPYTKNNSSAAIHVQSSLPLNEIADRVREIILADFIPGSDPGLCLVQAAHPELIDFGSRAKQEIVTQEQATRLAERTGAILLGLGGDHSGIIGALAAAGLAAGADDGRYIELGSIRAVNGLVPVDAILAAGVCAVKTVDGETLAGGMVVIDKLRPARRGGKAVAIVEKNDAHWRLLKLD